MIRALEIALVLSSIVTVLVLIMGCNLADRRERETQARGGRL